MNGAPLRSGSFGVITRSSWPCGVNLAGSPLTLIAPTLWPAKSRSKRLRSCVALARIVTVPSIDWVGALVA